MTIIFPGNIAVNIVSLFLPTVAMTTAMMAHEAVEATTENSVCRNIVYTMCMRYCDIYLVRRSSNNRQKICGKRKKKKCDETYYTTHHHCACWRGKKNYCSPQRRSIFIILWVSQLIQSQLKKSTNADFYIQRGCHTQTYYMASNVALGISNYTELCVANL